MDRYSGRERGKEPEGVAVSLSEKLNGHRSSNLRHFEFLVSPHDIPLPKLPLPPHPVRLEIEDSCPGREARLAVTTRKARQMIDPLLILSNRMRRRNKGVGGWGAEETEWW